MLGDERTYEKKRTFRTTGTSRTMSPDHQAASGSAQGDSSVFLVSHDGYLDPVVVPTASASLWLAWTLMRAGLARAEGVGGAGAAPIYALPAPAAPLLLLSVILCLGAGWLGGWLAQRRPRPRRQGTWLAGHWVEWETRKPSAASENVVEKEAGDYIWRDGPCIDSGIACDSCRGTGHAPSSAGRRSRSSVTEVDMARPPLRDVTSELGARHEGVGGGVLEGARRLGEGAGARRPPESEAAGFDSTDDDAMPSLLDDASASPSPPSRRAAHRASRGASVHFSINYLCQKFPPARRLCTVLHGTDIDALPP